MTKVFHQEMVRTMCSFQLIIYYLVVAAWESSLTMFYIHIIPSFSHVGEFHRQAHLSAKCRHMP